MVGGSATLYAGNEDLNLMSVSGQAKLSLDIAAEEDAARVQLDLNGQADMLYLGTVGAVAGRFVFEARVGETPGLWGVARLDTNFEKLQSLEIQLDAYCLLEVNTTNEDKSETLTLAGQAEDGGDLVQTFTFGPKMFRIEAAGELTIADAFALQGDFLVEVSQEQLLVSAEASLLLGPIGSLSASGDLIFDNSGVRARVAVEGDLGGEELGLTLAEAHGLFEINTTNDLWNAPELDGPGTVPVPAETLHVAVTADFNFPGFATGEGSAAVTFVDGDFRLFIDGELHIGSMLDVDVDAYVGIFDDDPLTPYVEAGVIVDAVVDLDLDLLSILELDVEGRLQINTTDVRAGTYEDPILAHSFCLDLEGDMSLLSVINISGQLRVEVENNDWIIEIPNASVDIFCLQLDASGWFKSSGEFDLTLQGDLDLSWYGNGFDANLLIHTKFAVSNAEPDFIFHVDVSGTAQIAGVDVLGARIHEYAYGDLGDAVPITLTVEGKGTVVKWIKSFLSWFISIWTKKRYTVNLGFDVPLGTIQLPEKLENTVPPAPLLAGQEDGPWLNDSPPTDGTLYLNVGDRAENRKVKELVTAEDYKITRLSSGAVRVAAFGKFEDFEGVSEIIGDFGSGNDLATLNVGPVNATICGGSENDTIYYSGTGSATLYGDEGDDQLTIDGTPSSGALYGGADNDTLFNTSAADIALYGDDGDDTLTGGTGDDGSLDGGLGNDQINGRGGQDSMVGGPGNDTFVVEIGELVGSETVQETVDGGGDEPQIDQITIVGDSSAQDLRVTMDDNNVVKISSYSDEGNETGSVTFAEVEAIMLSGGEGTDKFSVSGALDLGGVTSVVIDMGSDVLEAEQSRDEAADEVSLTLTNSNDTFELAPADIGVEGIWKEHFTFTVLAGYVEDEDKVDVFTGDGFDHITVFKVESQYGTSPNDSIQMPESELTVYLTDLTKENAPQFGPTYSFKDANELTIQELGADPPPDNSPLTVDTTEDIRDGDYSPEDLSLREAIEFANARPGADTILFDLDPAERTITLALGELVITDDLTITGPGADQLTISGDQASRIFTVDNAAPTTITVGIHGLSLEDGQGSAYPYGGGIYNRENLTVESCALVNNRAIYGGGIRNDGTLSVVNSTLSGNSASIHGGGIESWGMLSVVNSTISENSAAYDSGGIGSHGELSVVNSTISGNSAEYGGGICNEGGNISVANSTISGNSSRQSGGGILNWKDGILSVVNSTIVGNTADADNNGTGEGGGVLTVDGYSTTLHNTIVAGNRRGAAAADDLLGDVETDSSHNLIGDAGTSGGLLNGVNGNQVGVDPLLLDPAGLQDHGGPTQTIALVPGSPAINAGDNELAVDFNGDLLEFDQRGSGFPRIVHATVDIGAFEVQNVAPTVEGGANQVVDEGSTVSLAAMWFTDQWAGETHTATIDWGDRTPVEEHELPTGVGGNMDLSHFYANDGAYTVTLTVTDADGA